MSELRALTGARGLAAWAVVLYHVRASIAGLPPSMEAAFAHGYLAVDFFFLLSGFVIWLTWGPRLHDGGVAAVPGFWRKRVARIWPLHVAMLAFGVLLAALFAATGRHDPAFPWAELPSHLLLVQNWGFTNRLTWNDPAWSISCEAAAYLLFPICACALDWRRWPTPALLASAVALLGLLAWGMADQPALGADIPRFGLLRCLTEFGCGTILAALYLRRLPLGLSLAVAVLAAAARWLGAPEALTVPTGFAALLMLLAQTAGRPRHPLELAIVHYLGEISFATYLSHFLLWKAFKLVFVHGDQVPPVTIAAYLLLVLIASVALYHLWERPTQRWLNAAGPLPCREGFGVGPFRTRSVRGDAPPPVPPLKGGAE
ncbi:acyltransferase [Sphingomonas sp. MA1305]|uniref:acyltransferase family protein n=1 Tax=Sphingomonas sp. MA1305 TaxID=2479204 RepID=UPI0018DFDDF0|nr:acyltransferase [Sphingomonas sp. MA1305]MBI0474045.1 acyltransferase [Sphingomonas sp. MA1305]